MHDLIVDEDVSVDDGNGAALPGPALNNHKTFHHSIVPPFPPLAAGATVVGKDVSPRLQRQYTVVAFC